MKLWTEHARDMEHKRLNLYSLDSTKCVKVQTKCTGREQKIFPKYWEKYDHTSIGSIYLLFWRGCKRYWGLNSVLCTC
jgi:hypothetical protein